jgi:quercetin dioxygenase-like cupin family protein
MKTKSVIMKSRSTLSRSPLSTLHCVSFAAKSAGPNVDSLWFVLENQEILILNIDLAPSQASGLHQHNAHVVVYVLEDAVETQVRVGPLSY